MYRPEYAPADDEYQLDQTQFQQAMVDLGVNASVILAIAIALFLLTRRAGADVD